MAYSMTFPEGFDHSQYPLAQGPVQTSSPMSASGPASSGIAQSHVPASSNPTSATSLGMEPSDGFVYNNSNTVASTGKSRKRKSRRNNGKGQENLSGPQSFNRNDSHSQIGGNQQQAATVNQRQTATVRGNMASAPFNPPKVYYSI